MNLSNLILTAVFLISSHLESLDKILEQDNFESSFRVGDLVFTESKSCVFKTCDTTQALIRVQSLQEGVATIYSERLNGIKIGESQVMEKKWEEQNHNMARLRIQILNSYGFKVETESLKPSQITLPVNGAIKTIDTWVLNMTGKNQAGMNIKLMLEIGAQQSGIAQILRSAEEKGVGVDYFAVKEIIRRN